MSSFGFVVVAAMLALYVMLDGYDLGVAAVTPFVARSPGERALAMASIGPFWNGNEVWLIAAGGALFAIFPKAYASAFSGFYLPLMVALWLLMFRGMAMELRSHFTSALWYEFWDAAFAWASVLLIVVFGVALGNLVRGVPLDAQGYFAGTFAFLLNPYALLVAAFSVLTLAQHGAAFLAMRIEGPLAARARRLAKGLWWSVAIGYAVATGATFLVRGLPQTAWAIGDVIVALGALAVMRLRGGGDRLRFGASCLFVAALLGAVAGAMYPFILPGFPPHTGGLSIAQASSSPTALTVGVTVACAGGAAVLVYGTLAFRTMMGRLRDE